MDPVYSLKEIPVKYINQSPINAVIFLTNGVSLVGAKSVKRLLKELTVPSPK
tara:strand:- start:1289 stop:1444 length:156 start_codon:yes stop_codon:yes gene_type:complete